MALTDAALRALKPADKTKKVSDAQGLFVQVEPNGSRLWRLGYRFQGKQKLLALGAYPEIGLKEARAARDAARAQLRDGIDPAVQKKLDKLAAASAAAATFEVIVSELLAKKRAEGKAVRTLEKLRWLYDIAKPVLGERPIADITPPEILAVLRKVEAKGQRETAKRLRAVIGEAVRYAIATGRATTDPTYSLRGALTAPVVKHRAAIVEPVPFGGLLRAIDEYPGQPVTRAALQLMALLFQRPGELRQAEWSEFDLDKATWTIPASRMKMRKPHVVPLPRQAIDIIKGLIPLTGAGRLLLPGYGISGGEGRKIEQRPLSENTMNAALRRLGFSSEEMSAHGFRAAASTMLNEAGMWSADAIEAALAHQDADAVRRAYARGRFWEERVRMGQWWADELDRLRAGGEVIEMRRGSR
jgi:integrase